MKISFYYAGKIGGLGQGYISYHTASAAAQAKGLYQLIAWDFPQDLARQAVEAIRINRPDEFYMMRGIIRRLLKRFGLTYFLSNSIFDMKAKRIIKECDIFHAFTAQAPGSIAAAKKLGARIVVDNVNSHPVTLYRLMKEEYRMWKVPFPAGNRIVLSGWLRALDMADRVFVLSDFAYKSFLENGFPRQRLRKIPYGVDTELFKPRPKQDDVFRVLFIGQISLRKGFQYLLDAYKRLNIRNSELLLVGPMAADAKYALRKYSRRVNFRIEGPLPDMESIAGCYNQASVVVFPSIEDGFGMVVAEAMASGMPVIVSENTGAKDLISDGRDGFIVPIRDPQAIKDRILEIYEDKDKREKMSMAACKKARSQGWQNYSDKLIAVYKETV